MKVKIYNWIYKLALKFIAWRIWVSDEKLTPQILVDAGWVAEDDVVRGKTFWYEPNIKDRDRVSIEFENHYYRVWHGKDKTFIAMESSVEWLHVYLICRDHHVKFKNPNDIFKNFTT